MLCGAGVFTIFKQLFEVVSSKDFYALGLKAEALKFHVESLNFRIEHLHFPDEPLIIGKGALVELTLGGTHDSLHAKVVTCMR